MELPITALTAALLTTLYVALAGRIINLRRSGVAPSLGTGEHEVVVRAVRAHGNFAEYAPLFLVLLGLLELSRSPAWLTVMLAITFSVGRLSHAYGISFPSRIPLRTIGMITNNTALLVAAAALGYASLT